jgi:transcriptional regulator with XRE-family HTH domain
LLRLKFERIRRNISQQRLACATGIPQPVVSMFETGACHPTPAQLAALATELNVAPPALLLQDVVIPTDRVAARVEDRQQVTR